MSLEPRANLHANVLLVHAIQKLAQKMCPILIRSHDIDKCIKFANCNILNSILRKKVNKRGNIPIWKIFCEAPKLKRRS